MIIKPKTRGFICTTTHPVGCEANVLEQINTTKANTVIKNGPKKVLIVGASSGYGLSSRIAAAFGSGAATLGVFLKSRVPRKNQAPQAGITQRLLTNLPRQKACIQKASMVMPLATKRSKKPLN